MTYESYETLRIRVDAGIARATINLLDLPLILDIDCFGPHRLEAGAIQSPSAVGTLDA